MAEVERANHDYIKVEEVCETLQGRPLQMLTITDPKNLENKDVTDDVDDHARHDDGGDEVADHDGVEQHEGPGGTNPSSSINGFLSSLQLQMIAVAEAKMVPQIRGAAADWVWRD